MAETKLTLTYSPFTFEWNKRYMKLSKEVSTWSKDPSSKIGAVAIGNKGQVLAQGYNGFPRGIGDDGDRLEDRDKKYSYMVHAEMNCIYNATYNGVSLDGAELYVYGLPVCSECAKGIIQVGIKSVYMEEINIPDRGEKASTLSRKLFNEAGVEWGLITPKGIKVEML